MSLLLQSMPAVTGLLMGGIVGLVIALTGAGGGILSVPLLVLGLNLTMVQAAPVGLIAAGTASLIGAVLGLRDGLVRYRAAALIGGAGMLCAPLGVKLAARLPNTPLMLGFAVLLAFVAVRMFQRTRAAQQGGACEAPTSQLPCVLNPDEGRLIWTLPCAWALAGTGVLSGTLSGLLGVGGGFVIVPALTKYTNVSARGIVATSMAVVALVSVGGVSAAAFSGHVDWGLALPFASGAVLALLGGRLIAARLSGERLQQIFAAVSLLVALLMLARGLGWGAR